MESRETIEASQGSRSGNSGDNPILLTTREAAAFCMISESNFYKLNKKGFVPKPIRIGTMYRWRKSDLVEWVAAGCPKNWKKEPTTNKGNKDVGKAEIG